MWRWISIHNLDNILDKIESEHPYKVSGDSSSYNQYKEGWCDCVDRVRRELKDVNNEWISVEEKMPEESEEFYDRHDPDTLAVIDTEWYKISDIVQVTVYDRDEEKYFTYVDNTYNGEWVTFNLDNFKVITWKPLSDPYRPERSESK